MYKVLLVDDEDIILTGIESTFQWEKYGFEVAYRTNDSLKAMEIILSEKVDVVFTDIQMPLFSGIEMLAKARASNVKSEFVIISAHGTFNFAQDAIRYSVFDYLLKPINKEYGYELLVKLKQYLDEKAKAKEETLTTSVFKTDNIYQSEFRQLVEYVLEHYNETINLTDLSQKYYLDLNYTCVLFKKYFNMSYKTFLNEVRLSNAKTLLKTTTKTLEEISSAVGYNDYYYFNRVFANRFNIAPLKFRNNYIE